MNSLTGNGSTRAVVMGEFEVVAKTAANIAESLEEANNMLSNVLVQRDDFRGDNMELVQMRAELAEEKTKLAKTAKDRITTLQKYLQTTEEERDRLKIDAEKQEKRFHDLSEEFSKLRNRLKQYHQRRKAYGEAEERVCKKCQKVFLDTENYNWSCRTHQSEFGGEMWWCCGKAGKDAAGCRISKHESKEEDEEAELAKKEQEAQRQALQKCPSCKEYGHKPFECPKDPNYRSKFDLAEESHRLEKMTGTKHKQTLPSPEFSALALNTLVVRSSMDQFNGEDPVTSGSESVITDEDEPGGFVDIREMRVHVPKQRSVVSLEEVTGKDGEKKEERILIRVRKASETRSVQGSPRKDGRRVSGARLMVGHKVG